MDGRTPPSDILRLEAPLRPGKRTGGIAPATVEKRIGHRPDINGNYSLANVTEDATIQFSYIGHSQLLLRQAELVSNTRKHLDVVPIVL